MQISGKISFFARKSARKSFDVTAKFSTHVPCHRKLPSHCPLPIFSTLLPCNTFSFLKKNSSRIFLFFLLFHKHKNPLKFDFSFHFISKYLCNLLLPFEGKMGGGRRGALIVLGAEEKAKFT